MRRVRRILFTVVVLLVAVLAVGVWQRHRILIPLATTGERIPAKEVGATIKDGTLFGDEAYFVVVPIDEETYAIAEPRSWAHNFNYLILGNDRALLFDAGVGHYDIRPVVRSLTDLPLIFMPSHFHYDHTGQGDWDHVAIVDVPHIRAQADGNTLSPTWGQHLGTAEAIEAPVWTVKEWVAPGTAIDLGGRALTLIYTPGHTDNSVSLYDREREMMFTGDFITASGRMSAFTPTAHMGDFLQSADKVLDLTAPQPATRFRGAHSDDKGTIPNLVRDDVQQLRDGLADIKDGKLEASGTYPVIYTFSEQMVFQAEPAPLQDWTPNYPDGHAVHR